MKIVAAIATAADVEPLIAAGADELYCGVVPPGLGSTRDACRLNRRYSPDANVGSLDDFAALVERARTRAVPVSVTLNEHAYDPALLPALVELAGQLATAGAHALIVTDLALILAIRRAGVAVDLHLSSVATCYNSEAARFFADLGIQRVILPRYLSPRQISVLCAAGAPVDYEAFVMNDGCGFEEGLCMSLHRPLGPMCQMPWSAELVSDGPISPALAAAWDENWKAYRYLMNVLDHPGGTVSLQGVPNGPCGVCALPALAAAGVGFVKVPGREYPPAVRSGAVRFVKTVLGWVERGDPPETVQSQARALKATPLLCDSTLTCYFRGGDGSGGSAPVGAPSLSLSDLAAAVRFQRAGMDEACRPTGACGPEAPLDSTPTVAAPEPPPVPATDLPSTPGFGGPDATRLRRVARALADKGIAARWIDKGLELSFPDDAQPGGTSRVTVAAIDPATRCFATSGGLGLWYSGRVLTPRVERMLKGILRLL